MKRPHGFDGGAQPPRSARTEARPPSTDAVEPPSISTESVEHDAVLSVMEAPAPEQKAAEHAGVDPAHDEQSGSAQAQLAASSARAKEALHALKRAQRERRAREKGERRRFTRISRSRRRRWVIAIGSVVALALFVTAGVLSPALNLQKITVVGAQRLDPNAVSESLSSQLGKPLAFVDQKSVHEALSSFSLIQEYSIETMPPHELIVRIVERKPVLNLKRGENFDLVDPAGVVIETGPERIPGYPIGEGLVVDVNSPAFEATAQSLAYMQADLAAQVNTAAATTDQDVTFTLASGLTVIWGSSEQSVRKSVLVNKMLAALAGRPINTINVSSTEAPVFS